MKLEETVVFLIPISKKSISAKRVQKGRTNESKQYDLTALKVAKHDDEVITVLLIKILDNYKKKVCKRGEIEIIIKNVHAFGIN